MIRRYYKDNEGEEVVLLIPETPEEAAILEQAKRDGEALDDNSAPDTDNGET